jgi:hypothetical protein
MTKKNSFEAEGFFSSDVEKLAKVFRGSRAQFFALYRRIAALGYGMVTHVQNSSNDVRRGITTCLVIRTLSCYDAIRLCIERGMDFETRVMLRSQLEAMYSVAACEKDPDFHKSFIQASTRQKHQLLNKLLSNEGLVKVYEPTELRKAVSDLKAKLDDKDIPRLSTKDIATKAGMESSYELVYSFYSLSVHVNPTSLQEYIDWDDAVGIKGIVFGPDYKRAPSFMLSSMNTMVVCLLAGGRILGFDLENDLGEILEQWEQLSKEIQNERDPEE